MKPTLFPSSPIKEIAWLFAGIFGTMAPALDYLQNNAVRFGIREPIQFYWLSGALYPACWTTRRPT